MKSATDIRSIAASKAVREQYDFAPYALPVILIASTVVSFFGITNKSLTLEEGLNVGISSLSWGELWSHITSQSETNMSAYYILLKLWTSFDDSIGTIRALSAVAAIGTVVMVYLLGRELWGQKAGLWSAAISSFSTLLVGQGQEARSLAWVGLLAALSTYLFVQTIKVNKFGVWISYTVVSAIAVYFHMLAVLVPIAHLVAFALIKGPKPWRSYLHSLFRLTLLLVPFAIGLARSSDPWLEKPSLDQLKSFIIVMSGTSSQGGDILLLLPIMICWATGFVFAFRAFKTSSSETWPPILIISWLTVPPAVAFVVSLIAKPIFDYRYLVGCLPAAALLAGYGLTKLHRETQVILATAIAIFSLHNIAILYNQPTEQWKDAIGFVSANAQRDDFVTFASPTAHHHFAYYAKGSNIAHAGNPLKLPTMSEQSYIANSAAGHRRVWLIAGQAKSLKEDRAILDQERSLAAVKNFNGVQVFLYS